MFFQYFIVFMCVMFCNVCFEFLFSDWEETTFILCCFLFFAAWYTQVCLCEEQIILCIGILLAARPNTQEISFPWKKRLHLNPRIAIYWQVGSHDILYSADVPVPLRMITGSNPHGLHGTRILIRKTTWWQMLEMK